MNWSVLHPRSTKSVRKGCTQQWRVHLQLLWSALLKRNKSSRGKDLSQAVQITNILPSFCPTWLSLFFSLASKAMLPTKAMDTTPEPQWKKVRPKKKALADFQRKEKTSKTGIWDTWSKKLARRHSCDAVTPARLEVRQGELNQMAARSAAARPSYSDHIHTIMQ